MKNAAAVLQRLVEALGAHDVDAAVSCWHTDVDVFHPLRPDRSYVGAAAFGRAVARSWAQTPPPAWELVSSGVVGDRIYLETLITRADGTATPCVSVLEVEEGKIRRGRIYTDVVVRDGVSMDSFVDRMNT